VSEVEEHLERELRARAEAADAELVVDTVVDGSVVAAFVQYLSEAERAQGGRGGMTLLSVGRPDRRGALAGLLVADERRTNK
jgi:hypothetical protein